MSNAERPEFQALSDLEDVVSRVSEEMAAFRRRAQRAEAERAVLGGDQDAVGTRARIVQLEAENRDLQARVEAARGRVGELLARLRFLEEQMAVEQVSR